MVALDTETTGTNPAEARAVTAAIVHTAPGQRPRTLQWIIDPGVEIPDEAAAVHGWTNARLAEYLAGAEAMRITGATRTPMTRDGALFEIAAQVATTMHADAPLVVHNAAYDLTLLEAELTRHGIDPLSARPSGIRGVIDPMVIEKQFDPYRKVKDGCRRGKYDCGGCGTTDKTLGSLCKHYGVIHVGAHDAAGDATAAIRLAVRLAGAWPDIARLKLSTLHDKQVEWRRSQMDGLRSYFDRAGIEHDGCDGGWPVSTRAGVAA